MDVRVVGPSEWRCQEAASVADEVPNQVILWSPIQVVDILLSCRGSHGGPRSRIGDGRIDSLPGARCSFSYVTPVLENAG